MTPQTLTVEPETKLQAPAPPSKNFGSGCSHPNSLGLQLHSPDTKTSYICSTPDLSERNFCDGFAMKLTLSLGYTASWCARKSYESVTPLLLLAISDYKRLYTSLYFIITNFHTVLKPQVEVNHDMNSLAFTLYNVWLIMGNCKTLVLSGSTNTWSKIDSLSNFVDLHGSISLAYTSKAW